MSQADLEPDQEDDVDADAIARGNIPPAPPATPGTPARAQRPAASESPARSAEERLAAGLDHARLVSALGALAECRDEEERGDDEEPDVKVPAVVAAAAETALEPTARAQPIAVDENGSREVSGNAGGSSPAVDVWVLAGMGLSFAVVVGVLLLRPRAGL